MKTKILSQSLNEFSIMILSILCLILFKLCYCKMLEPPYLIPYAESKHIFITTLSLPLYPFLYKNVIRYVKRNYQTTLLLHISFMIFLSFCHYFPDNCREFSSYLPLFYVETFIYVVAMLTPMYVENIKKASLSNSCKHFYLLTGYLIIVWESLISMTLKSALFHSVIFTLSWGYFMKKDILITIFYASVSGIASALILKYHWTVYSNYQLDILNNIKQIGRLWENTNSNLSYYVNKFGMNNHIYFSLLLCGIILIFFTILTTYMILYITKSTKKQSLKICLSVWILLLILQGLNQLGFSPFKLTYIFYGVGNYFLFPYYLLLTNYITIMLSKYRKLTNI